MLNWFMRVIADSTRGRVVLLNLRQLDKAGRGKLTTLPKQIELRSWPCLDLVDVDHQLPSSNVGLFWSSPRLKRGMAFKEKVTPTL